jgi:ADP-ribose pyrophosphatase YjhB (NUDIX family)
MRVSQAPGTAVTDALDVVRALYRAINRGDAAGLSVLYHPNCIVEHVFTADESVYRGRDPVSARWAAELAAYAGALAGGHRIDVSRIAGIETGWGWVRSDWVAAVRKAGEPHEQYFAGHSHFWIEDGLIVRHRSVGRSVAALERPAAAPSSARDYPSRPIVGVGAVTLTDDGKIVLVKRRHEPLAGQWSLPGGMLELGETLEAGAAREMLEETGLAVDVGPVVEVFDRILVDDEGRVRFHYVLVDYLCRQRDGTPVAGTDVDDVVLVDPAGLAGYGVAEKVRAVVARAQVLNRGHTW